MHHFAYLDGALHAEGVDLRNVAREAGTPTYVYSTATILRHFRLFDAAVSRIPAKGRPRVFYATKANANLGVLATLARAGAGADVVSEGEVRKSLAAGFAPGDIVFSGVGKSARELAFAVETGLYQVNVESEGELDRLSTIAAERGRRQDVVLRINPDIGAGGHAKITTGSSANKFGVSFAEAQRLYAKANNLPGIRCLGLAVHIGSQILDLASLEAAFAKLVGVVHEIRAQGLTVERLDLGGGLGIPYEMAEPFEHGPDLIEAYAGMVARLTAGLDVELAFEPGRIIVGNAGLLLSEVLYVNERPERRFLVIDAAMNDLVRPAMYEAYHEIWPVMQAPADGERLAYDVVGPICESGDTFATGRLLPKLGPGDLIAFMSAGAYGSSMASAYNQRPLVAEVLVEGARSSLVRPRQSYEALIGTDRMPGWL